MRRRMALSFAVVAVAGVGGALLAQTPLSTGFTFQGRVKQAGQLVNDSCDFEFTLWDAATDGGQVGPTLTFNSGSALLVSQGLFSAKLDFGAAALNGDQRWLEVAVGCPSGEILIPVSPRQELTAAPYAAYSLDGKPPSSLDAPDGDPIDAVFVNNDGLVGIGTTNPTALLAVELPNDGFNGYDPIMKLSAWQSGSPTHGGAIDFHVNSVGSAFPSSRIIHTMSDSTGGELQFATTEDYKTTIPTTRLTIKDNGHVGIGTVDLSDATLTIRQGQAGEYQLFLAQNNQSLGNGFLLRSDMADGALTFASIQGGAVSERVKIESNGVVSGTFGIYHAASDIRLKRDISDIPNALQRVLALRGINFKWKDPHLDGDQPQMGLIAQEVEKIFPEVVHTAEDKMGTKAVEYEHLVAALIEALKEMHASAEQKDARITELTNRLERLEALVNSSIATATVAGRKYSSVSDTDRK